MSAHSARSADAQNRAVRTLIQGLALDVAVAASATLLAWLPDADISSKEAWSVVGLSVGKSVLTAGASWIMRMKVDPSSIPTPLPPADPGEPDDEPGPSTYDDHYRQS